MNKEQQQNQNQQNGGRRYIVLDIVFYGSSLNYDQGAGNYQELKKITKWDGRQYTLVSRYALRYSILETGKNLGFWNVAGAKQLQRVGEGDKTVIQPAIETLLSGEILKYPDFDLFGYLITNTEPQNAREAPVKISHAISLTPYNYDNHFCANLGLAKRMMENTGEMDPNLFNVEEHQTYYIYTVVIDVDRIGKSEVLVKEGGEVEEMVKEGKNLVIIIKNSGKKIPIELEESLGLNVVVNKIGKVFRINYELNRLTVIERIKQLIKSILYLHRNIKGRSEILHPKLLIVGLYKNKPYKSYKDRIILSDEYEEIFEEKREEQGKDEVRIIKRVVKLKKPVFVLKNVPAQQQYIKLTDEVEKILLTDENNKQSALSELFSSNSALEKIYVFRSPEVEVKVTQ
jgi:CRISPR-associated protein Cst2